MHHSAKPMIRTDFYKGHELRIETAYKITIDGKRVRGYVDVTNSGQVHYHPLLNRSASSAIDMVRGIIDAFPDEFGSYKHSKRSKTRRCRRRRLPPKRRS